MIRTTTVLLTVLLASLTLSTRGGYGAIRELSDMILTRGERI